MGYDFKRQIILFKNSWQKKWSGHGRTGRTADYGCEFADAWEDGAALLFVSTEQLNMLKVAKEVCFDATFKVVPGIYYQLLTVFVPLETQAFPINYRDMLAAFLFLRKSGENLT